MHNIHPLRTPPLWRFGLLLWLLLTPLAWAAHDEIVLTLGDGTEVPTPVFRAQGDRLILWLPSEFGPSPRREQTAAGLARRGIEVWLPDLHAAWFIPPGRYSLNDVATATLVELLQQALATGKQVYLMAAGRSAALGLNAVRAWQVAGSRTDHLRGFLMFGPRMYVSTPRGVDQAEYLPIVRASNLPIYILQPENSGGFWRVGDLADTLAEGGSPVFVHPLAQVGNAFNRRPRYTAAEDQMTARLPVILDQAMIQLDAYGGTPQQAAAIDGEAIAPRSAHGGALLQPYPGQRAAPSLVLDTLNGRRLDLESLHGEVRIVNFWATWCPPCVAEIPSLQRLYRMLQPQGLQIVTVAVGETPQRLREFLADKPVAFEVLLDPDGEALRGWAIYAFPTSLVVDRAGQIRYAVFGAFDWSTEEVIDTLQPLLDEASPPALPGS